MPSHAASPSSREHDPLLLLKRTLVARRINPGQAGAKRLTQLHGRALVCVRYRYDPLRLYRYTTVELVTAAAPIHPRRFDASSFGIHLERHEQALHAQARAAGARWDAMDQLWWLRGVAIRQLGLVDRIVKT